MCELSNTTFSHYPRKIIQLRIELVGCKRKNEFYKNLSTSILDKRLQNCFGYLIDIIKSNFQQTREYYDVNFKICRFHTNLNFSNLQRSSALQATFKPVNTAGHNYIGPQLFSLTHTVAY